MAPSDWKCKVVQTFDAKADRYHDHSALQADIAKRLMGHISTCTNANILEIGCGSGAMTQMLLDHFPDAQLHITDISPNMIRQAQANIAQGSAVHRHIQWDVMDGEAITAPDRSYDLIVSNMAFQWFEDPAASLARLQQRLTPSGRLFFSVPSEHSFKEWREALSVNALPHSTLSGFDWPGIIDDEAITIDYGVTLNFLRNLKDTGANAPRQNYNTLSAAELRRVCDTADERSGGHITWHILYGCLPSL